MEKKIYNVSQINKYVKQLFLYDYLLNNVWVQGEISNLKVHSSGHIYFTLKDNEGSISAVMFRSHAKSLTFKLEDGMSIIVKGYVSLYEKTGQYQLYVQQLEPEGKGALYKAFEQLKEKLEKEGLFHKDNKKKIPFYPNKIGIVTSGTGAAIRDIINVSNRRNPKIQLVLVPVLVQGIDAPKSIANAIYRFNEMEDIDLLIVGRGGGSIEDLWAFNEEIVARAIFSSKIPIISAVGHETDFTISDFVADLRAPTPSAAAELAVPSINELNELLKNYKVRLNSVLTKIITDSNKKLEILSNHPAFRYPIKLIDQNRQYIDQLQKRFELSLELYMHDCKAKLNNNIEKIKILSPENNVSRGYAVIYDEIGNNVTSIKNINVDQVLYMKLKDGSIKVTVNDKGL